IRIFERIESQNVEVRKVAYVASYNREMMHPCSGCDERILEEIRRLAYHNACRLAAHFSICRQDCHRRREAADPKIKPLRSCGILAFGSFCTLLQFEQGD